MFPHFKEQLNAFNILNKQPYKLMSSNVTNLVD